VRDLWAQPGPFTVAQLAAGCACSRGFIEKAIKAGALDVRRLGRSVRIPTSEARRFALSVGIEPGDLLSVVHENAPDVPSAHRPARTVDGR
jgi:excisionase family DNA binding protein